MTGRPPDEVRMLYLVGATATMPIAVAITAMLAYVCGYLVCATATLPVAVAITAIFVYFYRCSLTWQGT